MRGKADKMLKWEGRTHLTQMDILEEERERQTGEKEKKNERIQVEEVNNLDMHKRLWNWSARSFGMGKKLRAISMSRITHGDIVKCIYTYLS